MTDPLPLLSSPLHSKEELSSSDSLSPDPWKRDAREKLEKQQQLHIVDLLDKEIQDLQVGVDSL